jgi:hypothetical protein
VFTASLFVAGVGIGALIAMLLIADHATATERPKLQIEALKYGLGFFAAGGAVAALLLAVRRQQLAEHTHALELRRQEHSESNVADTHRMELRKQEHSEIDAAERRVTDLYSKAVEQLGHAEAAVRLGGLYALERVAQNTPSQRQTIVNVLCAYLRMPYVPPVKPEPAAEAPRKTATAAPARDPHQELQVRLTAQRILVAHLSRPDDIDHAAALTFEPDSSKPFWPSLDLDLTGATLIRWEFHQGDVRTGTFTDVQFIGEASFADAAFAETAWFDGTWFGGPAWFSGTSFLGIARFDAATFTAHTRFQRASFLGAAGFDGNAVFIGAKFMDDADFEDVEFAGAGRFDEAFFGGYSTFDDSRFLHPPSFEGASVKLREVQDDVWPAPWRTAVKEGVGRLVRD